MILQNLNFAGSCLEAVRFLKFLDVDTDSFTFQTFDDNRHRRDKSLVRIIHGSLTEHFDYLCDLNRHGAGIFVTVNRTDGRGRQIHNIVRSRGVWIETDNGIPDRLPIAPTLNVQTSSPSHVHLYFLLKPGEILTREQHSEIMPRLVQDFRCDKMATDFTRVLRLPGFYHCKDPDHPKFVHVCDCTGHRYTTSELLAAFPPLNKQKPHRSAGRFTLAEHVKEKEIKKALVRINPDDRDIWLKVGMALHDWSLGGPQGLSLWNAWSSQSDKYQEETQIYTWNHFHLRPDGVTIGTIFKLAAEDKQ